MKSSSETKWLRVMGISTESAYCLDCMKLDEIPDEQPFTMMYDRDYPEGFTCVKCCDVVTGEQK